MLERRAMQGKGLASDEGHIFVVWSQNTKSCGCRGADATAPGS